MTATDNLQVRPLEEIERCIVKRYKKHIWSKFLKAINDYKLISDGDRIAVAISGGKDSLLMAKMFQELKKYSNIDFELVFLAMDPGYRDDIRVKLEELCKYLNIPVEIFESGIFRITDEIARDNPCYMCARMRRGALYNKAEELGCNKLALGHHYDDVIETTMMNILCSGNFKTMLPKIKSSKSGEMQIIRPLYYIREEYIKRFVRYTGIEPLDCACTVTSKKSGNKRYEIKELISSLTDNFDNVEKSIFKAAQNVNIDSVLGWEKDGVKHSFMEEFEDIND
ncbi:tRNA 2-thiocytidine(32) synthetase TtcA [Peptacetobacter hiranonis]|uniref:PP-loop family protein n=1 Tax=Peptacetobacter hiranonis (strain DSM 13275 / JCM 10541 / KCTC 15199 / TO-931) TaxID=500633 RepID=B6FWA2_PEPHT|nr:tRNA 2-thiocytidine(32) synthetase TtcA [Peptacetobacter hiranonis]EEA86229.1 PP-loop family protein [Peptacetobacter hiranonis DSM 13275]QEK21306.1 tRNA 2-thiocytidine biosynthesis protein TtcA [Peptacetobacter hiranonis]